MSRLSRKENVIAGLLAASGEMYGLELVKASDGRLKRGTIYVTLNRMEDKGLVISRKEDVRPKHGGLKRRLYTLTDKGRSLWRSK